jgi:cell division protein FtsB
VERIAREELGLVRPGERVLRFPPAPGSPGNP